MPALSKGAWGALAAIMLVAAWLRFWTIGAGLPYALGVDEPEIVTRVVAMMKTGDFNPRFFDWPSLTFYVQLVVSCLVFLAGAMHGAWNSLGAVGPEDFYYSGRMVTAAIGTGTVLVLFCAARRWGTSTALIAAATLAILPTHVRESHFVLADVPTAFFTTLALLLAIRAWERPTQPAFAAAGFVVGLAASSKYNGLVAIAFPLIAAWSRRAAPVVILQRTLIVGGMIGVGFLLGTPYAVLDLPKFLNDYSRLASIFAEPRGGEAGWSLYLKYLRQSFGWAGSILAVVGLMACAATALRGPDRAMGLLLTIFPLLYFVVIARAYQIYARYTMPLLPVLALVTAIGAVAIWNALKGWAPERARTAVVALALLVAMAEPLHRVVMFDWQRTKTTAVDVAYSWIDQNVPRGAVIVTEVYPTLLRSPRYRFRCIWPLKGETYNDYVAHGVDYVLISSLGYDPAFKAPGDYPAAYAGYRSLLSQAQEVATFTAPNHEGPELKMLRLRAASAAQ